MELPLCLIHCRSTDTDHWIMDLPEIHKKQRPQREIRFTDSQRNSTDTERGQHIRTASNKQRILRNNDVRSLSWHDSPRILAGPKKNLEQCARIEDASFPVKSSDCVSLALHAFIVRVGFELTNSIYICTGCIFLEGI